MSDLAPIVQAFFTERLMTQRQASAHTVAAYRDTVKLLLHFATHRTGKHPAQMSLADLDAPLVGAFLNHLQTERGNTVSTRNARLAAIHSLFRYAAPRVPEHAAIIQQVLAIPTKRRNRTIVGFLTAEQIDALLAAPDRDTCTGRRDHALLLLATQTGLRVSELTALTCQDLHLGTGPYVHCLGKGRKDRCTPLTRQTVNTLRVWLQERGGKPSDPLFPSRRGGPLSRDAVEHLVAKHAATAVARCPTLDAKNISPHTLRHSAAMSLLQAGVDITVIALWLGHESTETTQIYLHADLAIKERALARTAPAGSTPARYHAPDTLLTFLDTF
jgi:site-specific recombinase XerD